jgi:hypothetical protein
MAVTYLQLKEPAVKPLLLKIELPSRLALADWSHPLRFAHFHR